jgi:hypothetical protein
MSAANPVRNGCESSTINSCSALADSSLVGGWLIGASVRPLPDSDKTLSRPRSTPR